MAYGVFIGSQQYEAAMNKPHAEATGRMTHISVNGMVAGANSTTTRHHHRIDPAQFEMTSCIPTTGEARGNDQRVCGEAGTTICKLIEPGLQNLAFDGTKSTHN